MAGRFSDVQWTKIIEELEKDPVKYGMPEGGREKSLVFASFNIRKLGRTRNRAREIDFLSRFCACCDLVAIQEVQDDLAGLRLLKERTEARIAGEGEFGLAVSDITGEVPGESGMPERLAFLYRHRRVRRLDMASDLTFDRTSVFSTLFENEQVWNDARRDLKRKMREFEEGTRKTKPKFKPPVFVTFVRTPYVVAFEVPAANDAPSLTFAAISAHLVYGTPQERKQEFEALLQWITHRLKNQKKVVAPNFVLLGDLNLDFDKPLKDRARIEARIMAENKLVFADDDDPRRVYFPFINRHPVLKKFLRSNARSNQTFDQIGFFNGPKEARMPNDLWRGLVELRDPDGYNFGVFDFAELFSQTLNKKAYVSLSKAQKNELGGNFEHSVSDHLPIWVRIPRPGFLPPPHPPAP